MLEEPVGNIDLVVSNCRRYVVEGEQKNLRTLALVVEVEVHT